MKQTILNINDIHTVDSYPYGRLRTKAFFSIEFKPGKGFRSVFQTINPKNGRENAPKKSTYYSFLCNYVEAETGHIKTSGGSWYEYTTINSIAAFIAANFEALQLSDVMIKDIFLGMLSSLKGNMAGSIGYAGLDKAQLFAICEESVKLLLKGYSTGENVFSQVNIPLAEIEALRATAKEVKFVVTESFVIG